MRFTSISSFPADSVSLSPWLDGLPLSSFPLPSFPVSGFFAFSARE